MSARLRLADLLGGLSIVADLGFGSPPETAMRGCVARDSRRRSSLRNGARVTMNSEEDAAITTVNRGADVVRGERSAAWAGLAFVALSTLWAVVVTIVQQPQLSQGTTQDFTEFYAHQSNRISLILASLSLALAGFALLWFLGGLRNVLRRAEGVSGTLSTAAVVSGAILGGLLFVFNALNVAVAWALEESDDFQFEPGSAQLFEGLSYMLAIEGAFVAAVFVGAASQVLRRSGVYPAWLTWGGLVIAVLNFLLAVVVHGLSLVLVLPWVCAVSLVMLRRPNPLPE